MKINRKNLVRIAQYDEYEGNANVPTRITKYVCPCGSGEIEDANVEGFDDRTVTLKCAECLKIYRSYVGLCGPDFELYER